MCLSYFQDPFRISYQLVARHGQKVLRRGTPVPVVRIPYNPRQ
ncbi:hypothetical protein ES703_54724 [subsurface metagenome]